MELGLKGRVAVVTGASKGIGKAIARGLADEGVNSCCWRAARKRSTAAERDPQRQRRQRAGACRPTSRHATPVKAAADAAKAEFGTVHILVNNAGGPISRHGRQIPWPDADWLDDLNLKIVGMLRMTQSFLPLIPKDGTGRIINISGIAGIQRVRPALTHGLNNAAMNQATGYLAQRSRRRADHRQHGDPRTDRHRVARRLGREHGASSRARPRTVRRRHLQASGASAGRWATMEEVADLVVVPRLRSRQLRQRRADRVDGGYAINPRRG